MKIFRLFITLLAVIIFLPPVNLPAAEQLAMATKVVGTAKYRPAQEKKYTRLQTNDTLSAGDQVRTGPDGKITLELVDGSRLELAEATQLVINQMNIKDMIREADIDLLEGTVRSITRSMAGQFNIRTGHSIASVRGTDFIVSTRDQATFYFQNTGEIAISSNASTVSLNKDMMTASYEDRTPLQPVSLTDNLDLAAVRDGLLELTAADIPPSLQKSVNLREIVARWHINYAGYLIDSGNFYDAESTLLVAHELTDKDVVKSETLLQIASIYGRFLKKPQQAFGYYEQLTKQYPQSYHYETALFYSGLALENMGDMEKAKEYFSRYLKEFPEGVYRDTAARYLQ